MYNDKIIVLAPHTDDEISCAGLISKIKRLHKTEIPVYAFVHRFDNDIDLSGEFYNSVENILGCVDMRSAYDYNVRSLPDNRAEILTSLSQLNNSLKPSLVLCPSTTDPHQDHQVITQEAIRAFPSSSIFGYENFRSINKITNVLIELEEADIKKKIAAAACYKSQEHKKWNNGSLWQSLARVRGMQIKTKYAEAYEAIRVVM